MEVSQIHKGSKGKDYWGDLNVGSTTQYKVIKIEELIRNFFPPRCNSILDIGSGGNYDHILKYKNLLQAKRIACLDYDEKIINQMRQQFPNEGIKWYVADIFELPQFKKGFDLIFLLDVLHEVYSFYGRPNKDMNESLNRNSGLEAVVKALTNISNITNPGGGIIIADAILPSQQGKITIRPKSQEVEQALNYFFENYPTKRFDQVHRKGDLITLSLSDFSILSRQYDKIKNKDWDRWKVERLEQHQYMTREQYEDLFTQLGFRTHIVIGTPENIKYEWHQDFEIIDGATDFPPRRVTLLAVKE